MTNHPKSAVLIAGLLALSASASWARPGAKLWTPQDALNPGKAGISAVFRPIIQPGETVEFWMGSPESEAELGRFTDETQHRVRLTRSHEMQAGDFTNAQMQAVTGRRFDGPRELLRHPAVRVPWDDTQAVIAAFNDADKKHIYDLPTEAQLEYSMRGGVRNPNFNAPYFFGYDDPENTKLRRFAWFCKNSKGRTHAVGTRKPNPFGLYDIIGNVWKWTRDFYAPNYGLEDFKTLAVDPTGPVTGSARVFRGGSWLSGAGDLRSAVRGRGGPGIRFSVVGFRLLRFRR